MVQYRKQWNGNLKDPLSRWLAWLNKGNGEKLAAEAVKMDTAIQAANERMVYVTGDEEAIRAYERRQLALYDYNYAINYAREKGIKKGKAEEKHEVARKMKNAGKPLSEIAEFTGLSEKTIKGIKN